MISELADIAVKLLAVLGLPSVTAWFLYDRRRVRNRDRLEEATLPDHVRTSSVVSLEGQIAALGSSFETDRRIKDQTIEWLHAQLAAARQEIKQRDEIIDRLSGQVQSLQRKVASLTADLGNVQSELQSLRSRKASHD